MSLLRISVALLAGVAIAALGGAPFWPLVAFGAAGAAIGLTLARRPRLALILTSLVALGLVGAWRYEASRPPEDPGGVASFNDGGPVTLRGVVVEEPEERERSQRLVVRVDAYRGGDAWVETDGKLLVTARLFPRFDYGDQLVLTAQIETPPSFEGFDYREYLARRGVVSVAAFPSVQRVGTGGGSDIVRALASVRRPLSHALQRALPEPESALARGILLGERASIPQDLTDALNRAGISHLVAISGYNVTLVAGFAVASLAWLLGRRPATVVAMLLVILFALFVGASPSVLRAAVMGEVMLGATLAGRPGSAVGAVALAGALLAAYQPLVVDDVSFQLSFAATLGIVLLAPPLTERLQRLFERLPAWPATPLAEMTAVTLSASVAVLPVTAGAFGRVSLVALPANLIAVPMFPLIMLASFVTAVAGALWDGLGVALGQVAYLPLTALVRVGRFFGGLPFASTSLGDVGSVEAVLLYVAIAFGGLALLQRRVAPTVEPRRVRIRPAVWATGTLALLTAIVWLGALSGDGGGRLVVSVLDVGQGDAILIEAPNGQRLLVDGGPSGDRLARALGAELPANTHRFDLIVLTHGQDDHVTGLVDLIDRYDVGGVLTSPLDGETAAYRAWRDAVDAHALPLRRAVAGEWIDLGGGARIEVLGPPERALRGGPDDLNDNSVILRLVYGNVSFMLTGDVADAGEAALLQSGADLHATVLKVAHHGSDGSSTAAFLDAVAPALAVTSVGAENTYGHPSPSTRLRLSGTPQLRTDLNGTVRLSTDGRSLWVDYDRGAIAGAENSVLP